MEMLASLGAFGDRYLFWILPFLFVLTVVVFFHELGHFLVARWCGVTVKVFSIGFGREIFGFTDSKGTRWRLSWIPLGGYVKFLDDENAASVPDRNSRDRLTPEERAGSFHDKTLPQRAAVVAAGPVANFVLAIFIFAVIYTVVGQRLTTPLIDVVQGSVAEKAGFKPGDFILAVDGESVDSFEDVHRIISLNPNRELTFHVRRKGAEVQVKAVPTRDDARNLMGLRRFAEPKVDAVEPGSPADKAGIKPGDLVVEIDGEAIDSFGEMQRIVSASGGRPLAMVIRRDGADLRLSVAAKKRAIRDRSGKTVERMLLGIRHAPLAPDGVKIKRYDPLSALWLGTKQCYFIISSTMSYLADIVTGRDSANQVGGPIQIAKVSGDVARAGFDHLLNWAAILSVSIGLLNLFPIPMLDGGHLLFYAIEAVRGRPLSERAQEIGFRIGLALVVMLMIWATRNDLMQIKFL